MADTAPRPASIADPSSDMSGHPGLDRWVLLGKLGGGAFSNVFRARDKTGEIEEVAIKVVRKHGMTEHQVSSISRISARLRRYAFSNNPKCETLV